LRAIIHPIKYGGLDNPLFWTGTSGHQEQDCSDNGSRVILLDFSLKNIPSAAILVKETYERSDVSWTTPDRGLTPCQGYV
jgi:hypothetical protein